MCGAFAFLEHKKLTVSTTDSVIEYVSGGPAYPISFRFLQNSDIQAVLVKQDGTSETLVLGTQYTLVGAGTQGGGTLTSAYAASYLATAGASLTIARIMTPVQPTDLRNQGRFLAETHESVFDRLTMLIQQAISGLSRALVRPYGKNYYDALNRQIKNLADPTLGQDAANKRYVQQQIAELLQIGNGSANNSANVLYVPNGPGQTVRSVQQRLRDFVSLKDYVDTPVDGSTSNQSGLVAAAAAAYANGSSLFVPFGDFVSDQSIPLLHDIDIFGPGRIKVGGAFFYAQATGSQINRIYVSSGGNDANDGLSATRPIRTIQRALNVFKRYAGRSASQFYIDVDASTLTEGGVLDGVQSMTELVIEGKLSGGVPITVLNGSAATTIHGLNFNACQRVRTKYLDVRNFRNVAGSGGIVFQNGTTGVIDTCVGANNRLCDFNCTEGGEMVLLGRCTMGSGSTYGLRYYRLAGGSIGDGVNPITITGTLEAGILMRDGSKAVCNDNVTLNNCVSGVRLIKHAYLEMRSGSITNNTEDGVYADTFSIFDNASGVLTFSGNTRDKRFIYFSQDRSGIVPGTLVPHWMRGSAGLSGQSPSGNYDAVIDSAGATGLQFLSGATATINIDFNKVGRFAYAQTDNSMRFTLSSAEAYRMNAASFIPVTDNTKALGGSTFRWSQVYAGTGTINTSDENLKQQRKPIDEACLRAWAKVSYSQYKFNDAVQMKGNDARWHFGVIAQEVKAAFESEGLDAFEYGVLCYDEWDEDPGSPAVYDGEDLVQAEIECRPAGSRYGIRYDEALVLECAYLRSKLSS
ncbi:hypothetical protein PputGB1_1761 [Pseudomonas putida GB-1]|uniref:Peptidase S74 domain-containing protein n=1 Tax=Pseudomonas putida (strain GB-1) TaxID=76869 RepID=B0KI88_PSEPG|nr:hypothetical protein PputGB1_1761 [Pseudomonas putida GB-1]